MPPMARQIIRPGVALRIVVATVTGSNDRWAYGAGWGDQCGGAGMGGAPRETCGAPRETCGAWAWPQADCPGDSGGGGASGTGSPSGGGSAPADHEVIGVVATSKASCGSRCGAAAGTSVSRAGASGAV